MNRAAFDPGRFNISYDEILLCYQAHIEQLFDAYTNKKYKKFARIFSSADDEIHIPKSARVNLSRTLSRSSLIRLHRIHDHIIEAASAFASIAAGCNMLDSRTVPFADFNSSGAASLAQSILDTTIASFGEFAHRNFVGDIHMADTVRVIRFLQITGLLKISRLASQQLSLGAFTGIRDLNAVHSVQNISPINADRKYFKFSSRLQRAKHTILVDPEQDVASHYDRLNNEPEDNVLALLMTADDAMELVANKVRLGELQPRNLVISMRIDHRMIPDARHFLQRLATTLGESADLVMTFGAGDNPDQFLGRIKAFDELEANLKQMGMSPIRIRMYDDSSAVVNDHRESPVYGIYQFASHEALYCSLIKEKMI